MLKKLAITLAFILLALNMFPTCLQAKGKEPSPLADSVVLMNANTGEILYSKILIQLTLLHQLLKF